MSALALMTLNRKLIIDGTFKSLLRQVLFLGRVRKRTDIFYLLLYFLHHPYGLF